MTSLPHRRRRSVEIAAVVAIAGGAIVVGASSAFAHVSFDKTSVPASSEQTLQARVPVEDFNDPTTANDGVRVRLPAAFDALGCDSPIGWTCDVQDRPDGDHVIWSRTSGTAPIDLLDFTVRTPAQVGAYAIPVDQSKSNGELVSWENDEGEEHPAPVLNVTTTTTTAPPRTAAASPEPSASNTPASPAASARDSSPAFTPATAAGEPSTAVPARDVAATIEADDVVAGAAPTLAAIARPAESTSTSSPAPVLAVVALLVGLASAGVVIGRRRFATPSAPGGD